MLRVAGVGEAVNLRRYPGARTLVTTSFQGWHRARRVPSLPGLRFIIRAYPALRCAACWAITVPLTPHAASKTSAWRKTIPTSAKWALVGNPGRGSGLERSHRGAKMVPKRCREFQVIAGNRREPGAPGVAFTRAVGRETFGIRRTPCLCLPACQGRQWRPEWSDTSGGAAVSAFRGRVPRLRHPRSGPERSREMPVVWH